MPSAEPVRVALLPADAELLVAIPAEEREAATERLLMRGLALPPGSWNGRPRRSQTDVAIVMEGLLARDVVLAGRRGTSLFGPGDLLPAGRRQDPDGAEVAWIVLEPARLALLGPEFRAATRRWPALAGALLARGAEQAARQAEHQAIAQLPRVEDRIGELLLHLAGRWGRVTPDGLVLTLPLTHEALGRLVGARRPTVSLALRALAESGRVANRPDGDWVLTAAGAARPSARADRDAAATGRVA